MFERPSRKDLFDQIREHTDRRLRDVRDVDCLIYGAGLAGLVAGLVLQENDQSTLIADPSEQIGGRLTWKTDMLPLFGPADELVEDLGFDVTSNPPVWVDRTHLLSFLGNRYYEAGGTVLLESPLRHFEDRKNHWEIDLGTEDHAEGFEAREFVVAEPGVDLKPVSSGRDDPLEAMVVGTGRRAEGMFEAGFAALLPEQRDLEEPFENAALLSGRKTAEIILSGQ